MSVISQGEEAKPACLHCMKFEGHTIGDMSKQAVIGTTDYAALYRQAFAKYGTQALWNRRMLDDPSPEDALVVARALRIEGDRMAREVAEQIESACRAAH